MASECMVLCQKWIIQTVTYALLLTFLVPVSVSTSKTDHHLPVMNSQKQTDHHLPRISTIEVVNEYPHDPRAFTEGLVYGGNNTLYESTGLYGKSSVRRVILQTGKIEALKKMALSYFGEGLTVIGERLYQLTWDQKTGFIYDRNNLSEIGKFNHEMNDGWGLTTDGKILFGSDGSSTLYHIDPQTMTVIQRQNVRYQDHEVQYLNELEFVNGEVWANIMTTDCIVRISPQDGMVLGWILLPILRESLMAAGEIGVQDILNGIAWDSDEGRIFVTGKFWPKLYEIKVHQLDNQSDVDIQQMCLQLPGNSKDSV